MLERLLLTVLRHRTSQYLSGMQTPKQLDLIEIDDLVSIGMAGKLESDPLVGLIGICRRGQSECAGDGAAVLAALDRQGWVAAVPAPSGGAEFRAQPLRRGPGGLALGQVVDQGIDHQRVELSL